MKISDLRWRRRSRSHRAGAQFVAASPVRDRTAPITDQELTLVQICSDFLCACIALPLALSSCRSPPLR